LLKSLHRVTGELRNKISLNVCVTERVRNEERKGCLLDLAFLNNEYFEFRTSELKAVHRKRKHRENFDFS